MTFIYTPYSYDDSSSSSDDELPERDRWGDEEVPSNSPPQTQADVEESSSPERRRRRKRHQVEEQLMSFGQCKLMLLVIFVLLLIFFLGFFLGGFVWFVRFKSAGTSSTNNGQDISVDADGTDLISSAPPNALTVGVYYYPWYKDDFHRRDGYLRNQLTPPQYPSLGEYDDSDPVTISKHLQWSRQANIDLWVSSWWGMGGREDVTLRNTILKHPDIGSHKIAIFYETTGRIKASEGFSTHRVVPDIEYLCQQYFDHPNYFRLDGKPVVFVYLTRKLQVAGILVSTLELMRTAASNAGCKDIYIVGDHVFQGPPESEDEYPPLTILDAVTNYDVYGSMGGDGGYIGEEGVIKYYEQQKKWRSIANDHTCAFIPAASPGYNDLGVRPEKNHPPLSRRLSPTDQPGTLFEAALRQARVLVDPKANNLLLVNSFNEFHEDTQIEPCVGEPTTLPNNLTNGLEYEGYGELYLQILSRETTTKS